jgi:hypothetical protein
MKILRTLYVMSSVKGELSFGSSRFHTTLGPRGCRYSKGTDGISTA